MSTSPLIRESAIGTSRQQFADLTPEEIEECRQKFNEADKDQSGGVDKNELKELLKFAIGKRMSPMMANRFIEAEFDKFDLLFLLDPSLIV